MLRGKSKRAGSPSRASRFTFGPARIRQAEQLADLVERLARRVVLRLAEQPVLPEASISTSIVWPPLTTSATAGRTPSLRAEKWREQMAFEMIDREERLADARPRALSPREAADHQRSRQPRTAASRRTHRPAPIVRRAVVSAALNHRLERAQMIARRDLRHHAAIMRDATRSATPPRWRAVRCPRRIATAVSSHEVSIASTLAALFPHSRMFVAALPRSRRVFCGVDHHALERIDGAIELRVAESSRVPCASLSPSRPRGAAP